MKKRTPYADLLVFFAAQMRSLKNATNEAVGNGHTFPSQRDRLLRSKLPFNWINFPPDGKRTLFIRCQVCKALLAVRPDGTSYGEALDRSCKIKSPPD